MDNLLKIYCTNTGEYIPVNGGDTLLDVAKSISSRLGFTPVCARVNNKTEGLRYPIFHPKQVEYLPLDSSSSRRTYTRSLCMILYKAVASLHPGMRLRIEHSISNGYYCTLDGGKTAVSLEMVEEIKAEMRRIVDADIPFIRHEKLKTDVSEVFRAAGLQDKVTLLDTQHDLYSVYYTLGDTPDSYYGCLAPSSGYIKAFDLIPYHNGMLLLTQSKANPEVAEQAISQEKMFDAFTEHLAFNRVIGIDDVGQLNKVVAKGKTSMLINVAEALHTKTIEKIAVEIANRFNQGGARIVLIAGPSSSGKTTSTKRLAIQLMTHLIRPHMISLDDYFVNRLDTPRDEFGEYDYESLYALDLEQFNADLNALLRGEEVSLPTYDFEHGQRVYKGNVMKLEKDDILLIEGIHGLNPDLSTQIPEFQKFKVYISALTTLSIDDHNWVPTSDNRLLRRIIRDHKYRGVSAQETIARWQSVRRGEEKWIFPFQENADAMFNSSLIFELGVMKDYVEPLLKQVPRDTPEYAEASRLLRFISYFEPISERQIPPTSLLREFLGGSSFHY